MYKVLQELKMFDDDLLPWYDADKGEPKHGEYVICLTKSGQVYSAVVMLDLGNGSTYFSCLDPEYEYCDAAYWMPLPYFASKLLARFENAQ
jgi:hypothetical protein